MLIHSFGAVLLGVEGQCISIEVDAGRGLPSFQIVGHPDRTVSESRDRVRGSFRTLGLAFPKGRVTVNLAPSSLPKVGTSLDLAIAVGVAATQISLPEGALGAHLLLGELGLDGSLRGVRGALALAAAAPSVGIRRVIVPAENASEVGHCPGVDGFVAGSLADALAFLRGDLSLPRAEAIDPAGSAVPAARSVPDLRDVRGQEQGRRALEIAAAGGHNLLLTGPPGTGKTLLATRLAPLLPDLDAPAALEATRIHSVAGLLGPEGVVRRPPFRAPHHTISFAGMVGGGRPLRPGELSLAHRGVLFLDELPEFSRSVLESLRQPLEEGTVRLVRAHGAFEIGARVQLVAAMNPCPCGMRGDPNRTCECPDPVVRRYQGRLSGPLLERMDLHVSVPVAPWREIQQGPGEPTTAVRERVLAARQIQLLRYHEHLFHENASLPTAALDQFCEPDAQAQALLERAVDQFHLSVRSYGRTLRIARTIADLAHSPRIDATAIAEALSFRQPTFA